MGDLTVDRLVRASYEGFLEEEKEEEGATKGLKDRALLSLAAISSNFHPILIRFFMFFMQCRDISGVLRT